MLKFNLYSLVPFIPLILVLNLNFLLSCEKSKGKKPNQDKSFIPSVTVIKAEKKVVPRSITAVAPLVGRNQVNVYAKVSGRLSAFVAKENQPITKGQIIARVDRSDPSESFLSTPVVSPINGWIGRWFVTSIGEQISQNNPIASIVDDEFLQATLFLTTEHWLETTKDTEVTVTINQDTQRAKIVQISRSAEESSGRGMVKIEFENKDNRWRAGMIASIQLGLSPKPRLIVSSNVLVMTDLGGFVYILQDHKVKKRAVTFALVSQDEIEILEGVGPGEVLVSLGVNLLFDDAEVKVIEKEKSDKSS